MREAEVVGARVALVRVLQDAHAGELAAAYAYRGHWKSLWRRKWVAERAEVHRIEDAEWHHRRLVADMLAELGERPRPRRELLMGAIGRFFGLLCFVGGHFGPMYAAGRLEAANVSQYEAAERSASRLGLHGYVACLRDMVVEEARHEVFFGDQVRGHPFLPLTRRVLGWGPPP
jgi:hypothetical protein